MSEKQIIHYIKNENSSELLYLIAVTCIEKLAKLHKGATIKAILDAGTTSLYTMIKK